MREIVSREVVRLRETPAGEREMTSPHVPVSTEIYHRYLFARGFCRDKDVLDLATGDGLGAAHLAQVARQVVAVEEEDFKVREVAARFAMSNLRVVRCEPGALPFADQSVDVVTSFETLAHVDSQEEFVAEARRVLRDEGCFIVSTHDGDSGAACGAANGLPMRPFDRSALLDLLHGHFRFVSLVRQRSVVASVLLPEEQAWVAPLIVACAGDDTFIADTVLPDAPYLMAIASDHAPRESPFSLLIERTGLDPSRYADLEAELPALRRAEAAARADLDAARFSADVARDSSLNAVEAERRSKREVAERAQQALEVSKRTVEHLRAEMKAITWTLEQTRATLIETSRERDRVSRSARRFLVQYLLRHWRGLFR